MQKQSFITRIAALFGGMIFILFCSDLVRVFKNGAGAVES